MISVWLEDDPGDEGVDGGFGFGGRGAGLTGVVLAFPLAEV